MTPTRFKHIIWDYYKNNRRDFPWRNTRDPYKILVSEIMLQQTQAPRVVEKYELFLKKFGTARELASAPVSEVLSVWSGLGYNRRALALKKTAEIIVSKHKGKVPADFNTLISFPGIGPATAGDILAFAWNIPTVVIETNIRSVFIHFFFKHSKKTKVYEREKSKKDNAGKIHDRDILPLIEKTLDTKNPREWYYALMDYGAMLKKTHGNSSRKSAHYTKQSPFKGSNRELRSHILKLIMKKSSTEKELFRAIEKNAPKNISTTNLSSATNLSLTLQKNLKALEKEGFITSCKKGPRAHPTYTMI